MTCKLSPTTKIDLQPVFWRVHLRISKNFQGNLKTSQKIPRISKEILVFSRKCSFFQHKSARQGNMDIPFHVPKTGNGPTTWVPMPCAPKMPFPSPTGFSEAMEAPCSLQRAPSGPHRLMASRGCHSKLLPASGQKTYIDRVRRLRARSDIASRLPLPRSGSGRRRVSWSDLGQQTFF